MYIDIPKSRVCKSFRKIFFKRRLLFLPKIKNQKNFFGTPYPLLLFNKICSYQKKTVHWSKLSFIIIKEEKYSKFFVGV